MAAELSHPGAFPYIEGPSGYYPQLSDMDIEHIAFFYNPKSYRAEGWESDFTSLDNYGRSAGLAVTPHTTHQDFEAMVEAVKGAVFANSLVAIRAGDGGVNWVVKALRAAALSDRPLQIIPGGNANDIAHVLLPGKAFRNPPHALRTGQLRNFHPLAITVEHAGETIDTTALGYWGIGSTGEVSAVLNTQAYRERQKERGAFGAYIAENLQVVRTILGGSEFELETPSYQGRASEFLVSNIPLMAKKLRPVVDPLTPQYRVLTRRSTASVFGSIPLLLTHLPQGHLQEVGSAHTITARGPNLVIQTDGEDHHFSGEIQAHISAGEPISILTTRKSG